VLPLLALAIVCIAPRAVDGDTIRCRNMSASVRLIGIDAPEMPGHCRPGRACTPGDAAASKAALTQLLDAGPVKVLPIGSDRYGRTLARVITARGDASCLLIAAAAAVERYSPANCR
jgi:endonuclease YncB( thermonuclease family)